jgi:DNA gyrase subunit A
MLQTFLDHRVEIITRRTVFDLTKTKERVEILEGLIRAIQNIEMVIELIRKSKNVKEAKEHMISKFSLSERQSKAILEMQLQRLTALEQDSLEKEREKCYDNIKRYESILGNESELMTVIKNELLEMRKKYGDERKSQIIEEEEVMVDEESFYENKKEIVMFSDDGYVKRSDYESYKLQNRGGVGVIGMTTKEGDVVSRAIFANTRDYLLLFTNLGMVYWIKVYRIPETKKYARGLPVVNLAKMRENESVRTVLSERDFEGYLVLVTKRGIIKKMAFNQFSTPRSHGKIAVKLKGKDELIGAVSCETGENIVIASKNGRIVNFSGDEVRRMGRIARGVIGMRLEKDQVVSALNIEEGKRYYLVAITEKGYGKRTPYNGNYRKTSRGCKGVKGISISEKNGKLLTLLKAREKDEILIASERGNVIKIKVKNISIQGRYARGVRLMRLKGTDRVKSATIVA